MIQSWGVLPCKVVVEFLLILSWFLIASAFLKRSGTKEKRSRASHYYADRNYESSYDDTTCMLRTFRTFIKTRVKFLHNTLLFNIGLGKSVPKYGIKYWCCVKDLSFSVKCTNIRLNYMVAYVSIINLQKPYNRVIQIF